MTNRQWLLEQMQNVSDEELAEAMKKHNSRITALLRCNEQEDCSNIACECCIKLWLKSEHKEIPKLSDAERVILENIDGKYVFVGKFETGSLFFKCEDGSKYWSEIFNDELFAFIKDDECYNIKELLKNENRN